MYVAWTNNGIDVSTRLIVIDGDNSFTGKRYSRRTRCVTD